MTLKIYVPHDTKGREWAPDTPHEVKASEWMLRKAWEEFHHLQDMYVMVLNLREPSTDMVIITERGLGVLELKHKFGEIRVDVNGTWLAGTSRIHSGIHRNPREQVRNYARELRKKVVNWLLPPYMQTKKDQWDKLKFQTGVCFTNSNAKIQKAQKYIEERRPDLEPWESNFSVIDMNGFTAWVRELRFELKHDPLRNFDPIRVEPARILQIAEKVLNAVEWNEIYSAMPLENPYAYLILEDAEGRQVFKLVKDHSTVGRSRDCDTIIPAKYGTVSNIHCSIDRSAEGITITDSSRNGTYVMNQSVGKSRTLKHGDVLTLAGSLADKSACVLRFETRELTSLNFIPTEQAGRFFKKGDPEA